MQPSAHSFVFPTRQPIPGMKELTAAVEEYWVTMIHEAIEQESRTGIPKFQKAMEMIEISTPRGTDNPRVWDTSNRAINLIINNLKGIFFRDDDFEHMAFSVIAKWGEIGRTTIRVCEFSQWENHPFSSKNDEILWGFQKCHRKHGKRPGATSVKQNIIGTDL